MANKTPEPWKVYRVGRSFSSTAELIMAEQRRDRDADLTHALPVNSAFAVELYLKCLRLLAGKGNVHGHDLRKLFADLDPDHQARVKELYTEEVKADRYAPKVAAAIPHCKYDVDTVLQTMSTAFEDWRYQYEETKTLTYYGFEHLRHSLERLIYELQPGWAPAETA
jgi:hypothetical protein